MEFKATGVLSPPLENEAHQGAATVSDQRHRVAVDRPKKTPRLMSCSTKGGAAMPDFPRHSDARSALPENSRAEMSHVTLVSNAWSGYFAPTPTSVV